MMLFNMLLVFVVAVSSLTISPGSERPFVPSDSIVDEHRVMFSIDTTEESSDNVNLVPQDIIIVLDTSGSMGGEKIINSKQAILSIVEKMRSVDYISLVTFGSVATTVFESLEMKDKGYVVDLVKSIQPEGMTNMYDSLLHTEEILKNLRNREGTTKRVYLFSDGEVNQGEVRDEIICGKIRDFKELFSVVTSSFGVGNYFNEKLMENIAEFGHGNYFYMKDGTDILHVVDIAFSAFQNVIGTDAKMYLHMKNGVTLKRIYGYSKEEMTGILELGDLRASDKRKFLIDVHIPKQSLSSSSTTTTEEKEETQKEEERKLLILEYELTYLDLEKNEKYHRGEVYVTVTSKPSDLEKEDETVKQFRRISEIVEEEDKIEEYIRNNDIEGAKDELERLEDLQDMVEEEVDLEDADDDMKENYRTVRKRRKRMKELMLESGSEGGESASRYSKQKKKMNFASSMHLNAL